MTARFYLLPIERVGIYRGPKYLKWRFGNGLPGQWSLKDFGNGVDIGLVISEDEIVQPDVIELGNVWSQKQRDAVAAYLNNSGIETTWVIGAPDWREGLQRIAGMALAMQANKDNPDRWLGRPVYCGAIGLNPVDWQAFEQEQQARLNQVAEYLRVRDDFAARQSPGWKDILKLAIDNPLALPFMALPATDAFTGVNGTQLTAYSGNWTLDSGDFDIQSNALSPDAAGNECGAHWDADAFNAAQYAQATIVAPDNGVAIGVAVRCNTGGDDYYYGFYTDANGSGTVYLFKVVNGSWAQMGSAIESVSPTGQVFRLEANGTTITPYRNGSTTNTPGAQTDSDISSGAAGVSGYSDSATARLDNWEGGNLGIAATPTLVYSPARAFAGLIGR